MKYIEDSRSLLERKRDAREYRYKARRENTATWSRITGKALTAAVILFVLALLLGALCTNVVLKNLVQRPRPYTVVEGLIPLLTSGDPNSFPSGHTCAAFAAGLAWAGPGSARWARIAAVVSAVCMGLSRLYVGVHYPSDVLAGAVIGSLAALAALALARRWEREHTQL